MNDHEYVRIGPSRSWHVISTPTRMINGYRVLCGRLIVTQLVRQTMPGDEKTCERCSVLAVRAADPATPVDDDASTWPESVP